MLSVVRLVRALTVRARREDMEEREASRRRVIVQWYSSAQAPSVTSLYIFLFFSFYFWKKNDELDLHNVDIVCGVVTLDIDLRRYIWSAVNNVKTIILTCWMRVYLFVWQYVEYFWYLARPVTVLLWLTILLHINLTSHIFFWFNKILSFLLFTGCWCYIVTKMFSIKLQSLFFKLVRQTDQIVLISLQHNTTW